jgi:hypothetical protein
VITKSTAPANYQSITSQIRAQAGNNPDKIKVDGERYEVTDAFQVSSPEGDYTVRKGSFFDNDLKTRDKVAVDMAPTADGIKESREYEHYSQKKLIFLTDERLNVKSEVTQELGMSWSHFSREWNFSV